MMLPASFPGQDFPPKTIVSFSGPSGRISGKVQKLNKYDARVIDSSTRTIWKVPYRLMKIEKKEIEPEMSLQEIYDFAIEKMNDFELYNWNFGFDLAQNRGGVCKGRSKVITLSVTYCLNAPKEEVIDTVLHEIAHALVGPEHGHNKKWKLMAKWIGCKAEVYHNVDHGLDRWHGSCPCGQTWKRKKLMAKVRTATCPKCAERITWKEIL